MHSLEMNDKELAENFTFTKEEIKDFFGENSREYKISYGKTG